MKILKKIFRIIFRLHGIEKCEQKKNKKKGKPNGNQRKKTKKA